MRGEQFTLSHGQITFDSPNLFTQSFLSDFSEATTRSLSLDSDPGLFTIIVDYLSGYPVLPLEEQELTRKLSVAKATRYLAKDADYLGLSGLQEMLRARSNRVIDDRGISNNKVDLQDLLGGSLPSGLSWREEDGSLVDQKDRPVVAVAANLGIQYVK